MPNKTIGFYEIPEESNETSCEDKSHIKMCTTGFNVSSNGSVGENSYKLVLKQFYCKCKIQTDFFFFSS